VNNPKITCEWEQHLELSDSASAPYFCVHNLDAMLMEASRLRCGGLMKLRLNTAPTRLAWKQSPRQLMLGVAILLGSGIAGNIVMAQEEFTIEAYQLTRSLAAGQAISPSDVTPILLPQKVATADFLQVLEPGTRAKTALREGKILVGGDVAHSRVEGMEVTLRLDPGWAPLDLEVGHKIRLWAVGAEAAEFASEISSGSVITSLRTSDRSEAVFIQVRVTSSVAASVVELHAQERIRVTRDST